MANRSSLDPEDRVLYGDSLQPPLNFVFDAAVATTFSLDFETVLAVPVSLALFAAENRAEVLAQPLALLEGAERIAGRLAIYSDVGRIHAQVQPQSRLCGLLERMIIEVAAPRGGAFHPKIWVLRYRSKEVNQPSRFRLLVLSRNLTRDRSWDICLRLDGEVTGRTVAINKPIVDLLRRLPDLTISAVPLETRALTLQVATDMTRVKWDLPEAFDKITFAVNGLGGRTWAPESCAKLGIISPFCDDAALQLLADRSSAKPILAGRSDELAACSHETLGLFERVCVLDEMASSEDGEEAEPESLQGLHAKLFVSETGRDTILTVGSGNATRPALISGDNVEVFANLSGKRSKVGGVEDILGTEGFGRLLRPFVASEATTQSVAARAAERRVEDARRMLCQSGLGLRCSFAQAQADGEAGWRVWLTCSKELPLDMLGEAAVWPITRGQGHRREILTALRAGDDVDLGSMPLADLTRFVAFQLADVSGQASALFSVGLPFEGLPAERHAAIFRSFINNRDMFFRYLRLLLSELGDPFAAGLAAQKVANTGAWGSGGGDDVPLLEDMVRALCSGESRLNAVERLISRLAADEPDEDPVPAEFRAMWKAFRSVMPPPETILAD